MVKMKMVKVMMMMISFPITLIICHRSQPSISYEHSHVCIGGDSDDNSLITIEICLLCEWSSLTHSLTAFLSVHSATEASTSLPLSHVEQIDRQIDRQVDRQIDILTSGSIQMHQQMDGKLQITYFGSMENGNIDLQIDR